MGNQVDATGAKADSNSLTALERPSSTASTWKGLKVKMPKNPGLGTVNAGSVPRRFAVTNLDFDVTENCNLGCLYCFKGEMYTQNMSIETMKRALEWLLAASGTAESVNCNFMGGEPTMRFKQIKEFVPWARRRGRAQGKSVTFSMTTNLTLFTQEMRDFVDEYGFGILMSIDGAPSVQDASRPAKNGKLYSEVVEKWAKSMLSSRPRSTARATLHPDYVATLAESAKYLHSIGFQVMAVSASEYEDWNDEHFVALEQQLAEIVDYIYETYQAGGRFNVGSFEYYINKLIRQRKQGSPESIVEQAQPCGAGRGYMMVDYTGDIWPCHRFDGADDAAGADGQFRLGNIFTSGFNHDLQSAFIDFNHMEVHKESCNTCPVNEVCGGYCPAANLSDTGSIYTPHDTYCRWTWLVYEYSERLYDRMAEGNPDTFARMMNDIADVQASGEKYSMSAQSKTEEAAAKPKYWFSPWALFDDDGQDVLVVNAFPPGRPTRLFGQRDELLQFLENPSGQIDRSLLSELIDIGAVWEEERALFPLPRRGSITPTAPQMNAYSLELDASGNLEAKAAEVRAVVASALRATPSAHVAIGVRVVDTVGLADQLTSLLLRAFTLDGHKPEIFKWSIQASDLKSEEGALKSLLDNWPELQLIVEDLSELEGTTPREELLEGALGYCKEGFLLRPQITTGGAENLPEGVESWQQVTDRAGVLLEPMVLDSYHGFAAQPINTEAKLEVASESMQVVSRKLGASIFQSEPWLSILSNTTVSGVDRWGWSKQHSRAYLDGDGGWARSRPHAQSFLYSSPEALFPFLNGSHRSGLQLEEQDDVVGCAKWMPDCATCSVAPLCDGYWSPSIEVLLRTGQPSRASLAAKLECEVRKDALVSLLQEFREDLREVPPVRGKIQAAYTDGILQLDRN